MVYCCNNKLNSFIKTNKDPLLDSQKSNVVYRIPCLDCNVTYVGQTKRQLNTRLKEHKQNINKNLNSLSVVSEHRLKTGYNFDWNNTKILDTEINYNKRLISESLHIKRQRNSINKKTDSEVFPEIYLPIIFKFLD
jgi:hypothetical protein